MRIQSSTVSMVTERSYQEKYEREEKLNYWVGNRNTTPQQTDYKLEISEMTKMRLGWSEVSAKESSVTKAKESGHWLSEEDKFKITIVMKMIELLTGKKIEISLPEIKTEEDKGQCSEPTAKNLTTNTDQVGWGLEYDLKETYAETEKMMFAAEGKLLTSDGKEISFSVRLSMSREFFQSNEINLRFGDAKKIDPLVINYAGTAPKLTNTTFNFDLDCDGKEDQIASLAQGNGFLALDRNGDGRINNGTELFGPKTGSGFGELAQYDEDNNLWIDENDSIFHRLRIWSKDEQGNDYLFALGEKGIGAIYLGALNTEFSLKDSENKLKGAIAQTGLFVREDGSAGNIHHIDLAV